ncbi:hypothetical protein JXQ70_08695 [bacterium]|nr:hypothetical protein [bacterium]
MLLLSRQKGPLTHNTWWFRICQQLLSELVRDDIVFFSADTLFFLDVLHYLIERTFPVILFSLDQTEQSHRKEQFAFTENVYLLPNRSDLSKREMFAFRDRSMVQSADLLIAVALRKNGSMVAYAKEALDRGIPLYVVVPPHSTDQFGGNLELLAAGVPGLEISLTERAPSMDNSVSLQADIETDAIKPGELDNFIWHYTRPHQGPWPDQSWQEYIFSLITADPSSGHNALDSLCHILTSQKLFASTAMIKGGYPVVCFSEVTPVGLSTIRRYQRSLGRWNLQPYGLGIRKELARELDVCPVIYGPQALFQELTAPSRFLFQQDIGQRSGLDWWREKEWRCLGDFDLSLIQPKDLLIYASTKRNTHRILACLPQPVRLISNVVNSG